MASSAALNCKAKAINYIHRFTPSIHLPIPRPSPASAHAPFPSPSPSPSQLIAYSMTTTTSSSDSQAMPPPPPPPPPLRRLGLLGSLHGSASVRGRVGCPVGPPTAEPVSKAIVVSRSRNGSGKDLAGIINELEENFLRAADAGILVSGALGAPAEGRGEVWGGGGKTWLRRSGGEKRRGSGGSGGRRSGRQ